MNIKTMMTSLTLSTLMVMSSTNWLGMWISMEINMISFIPMMKMNNKESSKSMMVYFLAQSIGSSLMLYSLVSMWLLSPGNYSSTLMNLMTFSLMIKAGMVPAHTWMVVTMNNLDWMKCLTLMTWQKLAPLSVMYTTIHNSSIVLMMICINILVGSIGGINQTSLRKIMAYSSISHMSWMTAMMLFSKMAWFIYLMAYSIMSVLIVLLLNKENLMYINQLSMTNNMNKLLISINLLSMAGMPPLMGFIPKWMAIQGLIEENMIILTLILTMSSLITLTFYLSIIYPMLMISVITNKISMTNTEQKFTVMTIVSTMLPLMLTYNAFNL
uniref:NADH-ubiquinone oxidoreductase chain 2 n=1 Tax=Brachyrhynchus hsiaoi TaxID=928820 RepID=A0A059P0H3_9HEMI|nr:NADH dehydrogenase subunit 2 [Brachyrhynchus hsiaoi]ADQ64008.1 NADH dehydrogenase subunit 2 [Brachyrhynchus hsiaoi]